MNASLPTATDNIRKFACLFGLALIVTGVISFTNFYTYTLDRQVMLDERIVLLESNLARSDADNKTLERIRKLSRTNQINQEHGLPLLACLIFAGIGLSIAGGWHWAKDIQPRDDKMAAVQLEKLKYEVLKLRLDVATASEAYVERQRGKQRSPDTSPPDHDRRGVQRLPSDTELHSVLDRADCVDPPGATIRAG